MNILHAITRRRFLHGMPVAAAALALPTAALAAPSSDRVGMVLAGDLAEQMAEAMAHPSIMGRWQITIRSGDRDQPIAFRQIAPPCRLPRLIDEHRAAFRKMAAEGERHADLRDDASIPRSRVNAALAVAREAYLEERSSRVALVTYRPVTQGEAVLKAQYVKRASAAGDWLDDEGFIGPLLDSLGEVL